MSEAMAMAGRLTEAWGFTGAPIRIGGWVAVACYLPRSTGAYVSVFVFVFGVVFGRMPATT